MKKMNQILRQQTRKPTVDPDISFEADIQKESDKAICVTIPDQLTGQGKVFWIPKSQLRFKGKLGTGSGYRITIPKWLADEKGIS